MIQYKKILMTLALLLTAATGAWADEPKVYTTAVDMTSLKLGDILCEGATLTTTSNLQIRLNEGRWQLDGTTQSMTLIIDALPVTLGTNATISMGSFTFSPANEQGQAGNAWIVTETNEYGAYLSGITTGPAEPAEPAIDVKWDAATKTGTFVMPAFDVEIAPIYAPVAQWAKVENVDQLPTAIEGIYAESTDAIVKAGTVAKIGETENLQGTLMYAVGTSATEQPALTAFSATVPTAEDIADAGDVYVWYYIKGADTPQGQTATAENTFNDSEICATPIKVTVLSNKFNIQFTAANANTIEAGKATVKVGDAAATVTEGKLEGVKMGSEVKVTAKEGYKFKKVEAKKQLAYPIAISAVTSDYIGSVVTTDGDVYATVAAAEAASKTPVAMIAYVGTESDCAHGLAIALADESGTKDYEAAGTACIGKVAVTGGTWRLPSIKDWQYMFIGCGASGSYSDKPSPMSYSGLTSKLTTVQGDALQGDASQAGGYWSSTESPVFPTTHALVVVLDGSNANFYAEFKETVCQVRACLAF